MDAGAIKRLGDAIYQSNAQEASITRDERALSHQPSAEQQDRDRDAELDRDRGQDLGLGIE